MDRSCDDIGCARSEMTPIGMLRTSYVTLFDEETRAFVEAGNALIIGTVGAAGDPCATRGWGLTVLPEPMQIRVLLDGSDLTTVAHVAAGGPIAVTAASIRTLESVQLKGRALGVEPADDDDLARADRYCTAMFSDIHGTDFTPLELLEQLRPPSFVACTVEVEEAFDQTPGPNAGERRDAR
jgi:hypothetical protein